MILTGSPITYLITRGEAETPIFDAAGRQILAAVGHAVEAGVTLVQIREKKLTGKQLFELTSNAVQITRSSGTKLLVNDRADVALAAGADGVHLTSRSLSPAVVRRHFSEPFIIGVSTHTRNEVLFAAQHGADFCLFGPVFAAPGKDRAVGLEELGFICDMADPLPILAIGGVDETNYRQVRDAGARGFAAIRSLNDEQSMRAIMEELANG